MKWNVFLLVIILTACTSDVVKIPSKFFSKEKMVSILIDIHLSDAIAINEIYPDFKELNDIKKGYFLSVLEKNNITLEEFDKSYQFYLKNPDVFFEVYEEVMIELTKREAELNGVNEIEHTITEEEMSRTKGFQHGYYDENDNYQDTINEENTNQDE